MLTTGSLELTHEWNRDNFLLRRCPTHHVGWHIAAGEHCWIPGCTTPAERGDVLALLPRPHHRNWWT